MMWLLRAAKRLKEHGILGMNARNARFILDHNPRNRFPIVDDKLRMRDVCQRIGVPTPTVYSAVRAYAQLGHLQTLLCQREDFVIKPNRGSAGRGILVIVDRDGNQFLRHNGERLGFEHLRQHLSDILSGMYSLGGRPDAAIIQQRVRLHPAFEPICYKGIPDIRVIVYRNVPAMAMLRLPTKASNGRANLHQGGIGTGVDLETGLTHHAVLRNRACKLHPDTGVPVVGMRVPFWKQVLEMSRRAAEAIRLGYVGIDIIVDAEEGPMLLEANARPGLAIQIANGQGLVPRLEEIDAELDNPSEVQEEVPVAVIAGRIGVEDRDSELRRRSA